MLCRGLSSVNTLVLQRSPDLSLRTLLRPTVFVPETKRVDELMLEMRRSRQRMAVAVDKLYDARLELSERLALARKTLVAAQRLPSIDEESLTMAAVQAVTIDLAGTLLFPHPSVAAVYAACAANCESSVPC